MKLGGRDQPAEGWTTEAEWETRPLKRRERRRRGALPGTPGGAPLFCWGVESGDRFREDAERSQEEFEGADTVDTAAVLGIVQVQDRRTAGRRRIPARSNNHENEHENGGRSHRGEKHGDDE